MATDSSTKKITLGIDDGEEEVSIVNKNGKEIGVFRFSPADMSVLTRYDKAVEMIEAAMLPLQEMQLATEQADQLEEDTQNAFLAALKKAEADICAAFDYLFGGDVSGAFFSTRSPFTLVNGFFYCENVINALGGFISERMGAETRRMNSRVERFTRDFMKPNGKHSGGKKQTH